MAALPKPSSLSKTLSQLTRSPQVKLPSLPHNGVKRLKLTLATRNAHFGARHFLKDELPRLAFSNPNLDIAVERKEHLRSEPWAPELLVEFANGKTSSIDMTQKHSSLILKELIHLTNATTQSSAPVTP